MHPLRRRLPSLNCLYAIDAVARHMSFTEAARRLEGGHPLAATLLLRASIQYVLTYGVATRYAEAARQLLEAESLAAMIGDHGEYPDHAAFVADLRALHGRKRGFVAELEADIFAQIK